MILLPSNAEVCLLGDFNVDYLSKQRTHGYALKHKLALFANSHQLNQLIETPMRITEQSATTIDLLFVNNKYRVAESGVMYAHISDHLLIYCVLKSGVQKGPGKSIYYRSYKHYSKERFLADLRNENWDSFIPLNDVNEAASIWTKAFLNVADKHAPMKQSRVKGNDVPWMSSALKDIMNQRNCLYRKAIKSKNPVDWTKYKEVKNSVNTQIRKCKSNYYCNVIEESKSQPKSLWKHLNNITLRKPNSNVSSLLDDGKSYLYFVSGHSSDIKYTLFNCWC